MSGLEALDLSGNNLNGQLPIVWSNMTGMMSLNLSGNNFTVSCMAASTANSLHRAFAGSSIVTWEISCDAGSTHGKFLGCTS
jgi:hypothetical protein